jgi:hypothetical protein
MKTGKPIFNLHFTGILSTSLFIFNVFCILLLYPCLKSNAQNVSDSVNDRLRCYYSGTEKVFLHLNKDTYISGEEVLFKAYLVNGPDFKPDTLCKVLYMVLKNCNNQKINGLRLNLKGGTCQGYFLLPDTLATGYYTIFAFTNKMRNFSHDLYFTSRIFVGNQGDDNLDKLVTATPDNPDTDKFSVFPESGKLLTGLPNRVVFLFSEYREGSGQSAAIISDLNGIIDTVPVSTSGMGEISITPRAGEKFFIRFQNRDYPFNITATTGFGLKALLNVLGDIDIKIQTNIKDHRTNPLLLVCYSERQKTIDIPILLTGDSSRVSLTGSKIGTGIVHLCLLDSSMNLLCERLIYRPDPLQGVSLQLNSRIYGTRQKVQVAVRVLPSSGSSDRTYLSANVSQKFPVSGSAHRHGNISKTFLFSEFGNNSSSLIRDDSLTYQTIDQFLISHKSQQYSWENIFTDSKLQCKFLAENGGFILSGKVVTKSQEPVPGTCVYLSAPDSFVNLKYCYTDDNGRFLFSLNRSYDNKNLVFQAKQIDSQDGARIELEDKFIDEPAKPAVIGEMPPDLRNYLFQSRIISLVNKIYKPLLIKHLPVIQTGQVGINSNFFGLPDATIFTSDYTELDNFNEIAKNILPGIKYSANMHSFRVLDAPSNAFFKEDAMLFLNNIPFPDPIFVSKLDSRLIRKIELKKNHLLFGELNIYGIVAIVTNQKNVYAMDEGHMSLVYPNKVNDLPISVSGPDYNGNVQETETLPDFRQTLCWNPEFELINGQSTLEFYTSDVKGVFSIEIEGITSNGQPLSGQTQIEVQ